jgi:HK97 family phage prohead protease
MNQARNLLKMEMQYKQVSFETKSVSDNGQIEGYASVFGNVDSYGDVVVKGAFSDFLSNNSEKKIPILWQHDTREPVGVASQLKEDDKGLYMMSELALKVRRGQEAHELAKMGAITGFSIGYTVEEERFSKQEGINYLTRLKLWEVSIVTFPANEKAQIEGVKQILTDGGMPSEREIEDLLRRAGFSKTQSKTFISKGYRSLLNRRDADEEQAIQLIEGLKANLKNMITR